MKRPRIAYICGDPGVPVFGRKGCSIHVQEVVRALVGRGADVTLFAARFDGSPPPDLSAIVTVSLPSPRGGDLAIREQRCLQANRELRDRLEEMGPFDLVYERYSLWSFAGMSYAWRWRCPGFLEVNAPLIEEQATHRGLVDQAGAERVAAQVFTHASALVAVSDEVAGYLKTRGVRTEKIHVMPNAVNPHRFVASPPRVIWRGNQSTFTVGFVGTLKPWHGVASLVEAFAMLHRRFPGARLLVVGDGPERSGLMARVEELCLQEFTHFAGAVAADEVPGFLAAMDVAVAPYPKLNDFYFSPLKAFEYLAAGRAVVASRIGQLCHLIEHERNGLLYEPGDVAALAAYLARLYTDQRFRRELGTAARETILNGHTWDHVAGQILDLASGHQGSSPENETMNQNLFCERMNLGSPLQPFHETR
ncbi:glycosyltransferase [bacterium]|nr:glycosyltransferase [bacterium]